MEAIAGVQDRLAASSAWVGASAAWISEDVTPFRPISPAWVQRQLANHVAVTVPAHVAVPAQALDLPPEATLLAELYQSAYRLTHVHSRWPIDWMRFGSLIKKDQASLHALTIAS
jgi:urease accessory protein UreF